MDGIESKYVVKNCSNLVDQQNGCFPILGLHPNLLSIDSLRSNTFHLKCAVTRKFMKFIRKFLLQQATQVSESFLRLILKRFCNDYHIYVWNNRKICPSFFGNKIALFEVVRFLNKNILPTALVDDITTAFEFWMQIWKFLSISHQCKISKQEYQTKLHVKH